MAPLSGELAGVSPTERFLSLLHHMRLCAAVQPEQLHQITACVEIAADALARKAALTAERDDVRVPERLPAAGFAHEHLHGGHTAELQRFQNGHAVIGIAARTHPLAEPSTSEFENPPTNTIKFTSSKVSLPETRSVM